MGQIKTQDDNAIHRLEHDETVITSKYENNGYWLWDYYLEYLKGQLVTGRLLCSINQSINL